MKNTKTITVSTLIPIGPSGGALIPKPVGPGKLPCQIHEALAVADFPTEELGLVPSEFAQDLSIKFRVPPEVPSLAALAIVSGMAGRPGTIWTGREAVPISLFAVVSAAPGSDVRAALTELIQPVREEQTRLLEEAARVKREDVVAEIEKLSAKKPQDTRILRKLHNLLRPLFTIENLQPQSILEVLKHSFDERLLHFSTQDDFTPAMARTSTSLDLGLISKCLSGSPVQVTDNNQPPIRFAAPALSSIIVTTPDGLNKFLSCYDRLPIGMRDAVIALDAGVQPLQGAPELPSLDGKYRWADLVESLLRARLGDYCEGKLYASDGAEKLIQEFQDQIVSLLPAAPLPLRDCLTALPRLAWRLSAAIHILHYNSDDTVLEGCVASAVRIAKFYARKHMESWLYAQARAESEESHVQIEAVFVRIRLRGPITRRELYRTFKVQRAALYEPVIERLLALGRVVEDEQGRLLATPAD